MVGQLKLHVLKALNKFTSMGLEVMFPLIVFKFYSVLIDPLWEQMHFRILWRILRLPTADALSNNIVLCGCAFWNHMLQRLVWELDTLVLCGCRSSDHLLQSLSGNWSTL